MPASSRLTRLRDQLKERDIDSMLVSASENRRYLSGFTGSSGYLLISASDAVLATDFRYVEQAGRESPDFTVHRVAGGSGWFPELASQLGVRRVGIESQDMALATYTALKKSVEEAKGGHRPELVSTSGIVDGLRAVKDEDELALLTRAVEIADRAFEQVAPTIEPGVTEQQIAWELEKAMRDAGAEVIAFDIIVAAGPNGALPHHRADETVVRDGDAVVIDMGARYRGYCSDLSRTVVVGEPDETFRRVYDTVLRAQLEAEETVSAGMTGAEADAIARDVIMEADYGDNFGHSLGHGVGLAVHENPRLGPSSDDLLEDGMVFTIEPGIYLSGWGGVRIEDMAVLEKGRVRVLSKAHKSERAIR